MKYIEDFVEDKSTKSSDLFDCDYIPIKDNFAF